MAAFLKKLCVGVFMVAHSAHPLKLTVSR
jgi:hypothetical protein